MGRRGPGSAVTAAGAAALLALVPVAVGAASHPGLEAHLGAAWNAPVPLRVRQEAWPDLALTARYATRAFELPLYYVCRLLVLDDAGRGWALDLVHHKLHLENPPPEIGAFAVSHGYNLLTLSRLGAWRSWRWGVGGGAVVAHPENTVRGLRLSERRGMFRDGYYVSGATAGAFAGRCLALPGGLHATAEARATVSWARVPVVGGSADVPNLALHATLGLGWRHGGGRPARP